MLKNRKNWKQYLSSFLLPLLWCPVCFFRFTINYVEQSAFVSTSSFHTGLSIPVVRILPPLLWRNCFLHVTALTYGWNWPPEMSVTRRSDVCLVLGLPKPLWNSILCPFSSELFLPWLLWCWPHHIPYDSVCFLCYILHCWILHQACLDKYVTQIFVSYLFYINICFESLSTLMVSNVIYLQMCSKSMFDSCFLQFTQDSTSKSVF